MQIRTTDDQNKIWLNDFNDFIISFFTSKNPMENPNEMVSVISIILHKYDTTTIKYKICFIIKII